jgi:hypothetical protein
MITFNGEHIKNTAIILLFTIIHASIMLEVQFFINMSFGVSQEMAQYSEWGGTGVSTRCVCVRHNVQQEVVKNNIQVNRSFIQNNHHESSILPTHNSMDFQHFGLLIVVISSKYSRILTGSIPFCYNYVSKMVQEFLSLIYE